MNNYKETLYNIFKLVYEEKIKPPIIECIVDEKFIKGRYECLEINDILTHGNNKCWLCLSTNNNTNSIIINIEGITYLKIK